LTLAIGSVACVSQAELARHARNAAIDARTMTLTKVIENTEDERIAQITRRHEHATAELAGARMSDQAAAKLWIKAHEQRSTYEVAAAARLDTIAVRIDAARQKLGVLGDLAPGTLRNELTALELEYRKLEPVVRNLAATPAADWNTTITALNERLAELSARVSLLTAEIKDQQA
jgi:hypothetical protein